MPATSLQIPMILLFKKKGITLVKSKLDNNNNFDLSSIKRIYFIENKNTSILRRWQGHKIEQRWFSAVIGSFKILF